MQDPREVIVRNLFRMRAYENSLGDVAESLLSALFDDIAADLAKIDPTGPTIPRYRKARADKLFALIEERTGDVYRDLTRQIRAQLALVGKDFAERTGDQLRVVLGNVATPDVPTVSATMLRTLIDTDPIQGATLKSWFADQKQRTAFRTRQQIQLGMVNGETIDDMVRRVRGRALKPGVYTGGVMQTSTREATAIVRTAVNHICNESAARVQQANADIAPTYTIVATLDSRTCFIAGTPVLTPEGLRRIEEIREGDMVVGGSRAPRRVAATRAEPARRLARVTLTNGEVVYCTPDHRFLTESQEWVEARDLSPGAKLAEVIGKPYI